eukprot:904348-Pelagomonas_calceolata.AAC.8
MIRIPPAQKTCACELDNIMFKCVGLANSSQCPSTCLPAPSDYDALLSVSFNRVQHRQQELVGVLLPGLTQCLRRPARSAKNSVHDSKLELKADE